MRDFIALATIASLLGGGGIGQVSGKFSGVSPIAIIQAMAMGGGLGGQGGAGASVVDRYGRVGGVYLYEHSDDIGGHYRHAGDARRRGRRHRPGDAPDPGRVGILPDELTMRGAILDDFDRPTLRAVAMAYRDRRFAGDTELAAVAVYRERHPEVPEPAALGTVGQMIFVAISADPAWFWRDFTGAT